MSGRWRPSRDPPRHVFRAAARKALTALQVERRLTGEAVEQALRQEIAEDEENLIRALLDGAVNKLMSAAH